VSVFVPAVPVILQRRGVFGPGGFAPVDSIDWTSSTSIPAWATFTATGLWARLRHNAEPANLQAKIAASATAAAQLGITIYKQAMIAGQLAWTADGTTAGPAYLNNVGVIA